MIDITGLNKAKVLAALYNASKPQGLGFLQANKGDMTEHQAFVTLCDNPKMDFDYLQGRVLKINLVKDEIDPYLYDRDNGTGAAKTAIDSIR